MIGKWECPSSLHVSIQEAWIITALAATKSICYNKILLLLPSNSLYFCVFPTFRKTERTGQHGSQAIWSLNWKFSASTRPSNWWLLSQFQEIVAVVVLSSIVSLFAYVAQVFICLSLLHGLLSSISGHVGVTVVQQRSPLWIQVYATCAPWGVPGCMSVHVPSMQGVWIWFMKCNDNHAKFKHARHHLTFYNINVQTIICTFRTS